ncbi:unnamed protein product [Protopolystoma xenopodis]|uniref:V-SNARE coiled-coil homology domain-containing protein n=1 Tax=Protopolystoma xenopodis TaxID=117903 RepID=A0A448X017_9PLAT|nr:unnamed protein product [Protopolystoma xenopodis]
MDQQVHDVTNVMRSNIKQIMDRENKLEELVTQTNDLQQSVSLLNAVYSIAFAVLS